MSHNIIDPDARFIIDADTRSITNESGEKLTIAQYDHNSERVTFELPRYIENHDMSLCDLVLVLFTNTSRGTSVSTRSISSGAYQVTDLAVDRYNPKKVTCSWLIPRESTQYSGTLKFQMEFICHEDIENKVLDYSWHTNQCDMIDILPSLDSSNNIETLYPTIIAQFDERIGKLEEHGVPQDRLQEAVNEYFTANPVEKLTDEELRTAITQYFVDNPIDGLTMTDVNTAINTAITNTYKSAIVKYVIDALEDGDGVSY